MSLDKLQVCIALPQAFPDGKVDVDLIRHYCARAESLGYHGLWTQEQVLGSTAVLDPLSLLTYATALTSRAELGVSVLVLPLHNPVQLAKQVSSMDQMSGGRLILGVGLGGATGNYPAFGITDEVRVRRFLEIIRVMRALWSDGGASYEGTFYNLNDVSMEPKPLQRPRVPIWFGARHPNSLRRAVKYGDSWMGAGSSPFEQFKEHAVLVKRYLEESDRDPGEFIISKRLYLAIDDDESRAERRLREWFGQYYGRADMANEVAIWGSADRVVERIEAIAETGASHILLNPVFDLEEHLEQLAELTRLADR